MRLSLNRVPRFAPRGPRSAVTIDACLVLADDRVVAITVRNLSRHGFMGETPARLRSSTWVGVALPGYGIVRARVRWNEGGEIGCQFRRPLDPERLKKAIADHAGSSPLFAA